MTINTTPTIPTQVDLQADFFITQMEERLAPVQHWTRAAYGDSFDRISEQNKLATIHVVEHAVAYGGWKTDFTQRRAASEALRLATGRLMETGPNAPSADYKAVYARMIGKLASHIAATFVPDPSEDDACRCGQPDCGAC